MAGRLTPIEADLKQLWKGRGIREARSPETLSGELRRLCRIGDRDGEAQARHKLVRTISGLIARLPADLGLAASAALALHPETEDMRYLKARIDWLAGKEDYSDRTARRRMDDAMKKMVLEAKRDLAQPPEIWLDPDQGWYVESLRTRLDVGRASPHAVEERRIVVIADGLVEIIHRANIPPAGNGRGRKRDLEFDVMYGGTRRLLYSSGSHFQYAVTLPAPMNADDQHEYGVVMRIPPGQEMAPQYVCVPLRRHDLFELRVAFDLKRLPTRIWRLDAVAPRVIDDRIVTEPLLEPNRVGEVHAEFRDLRVGFGYGIQWEP